MIDINQIITVSIIDVIGKYEDGISLMLSVLVYDEMYEIAYWFNKDGQIRLVPEQRFIDMLGVVETIYDYELIEDLIYVIHTNIPNMDKIQKEFL